MKESGQVESGLKRLLTISRFYELFQKTLGGDNARKWLAKNIWKPKSGETIVDVGCGSGLILEHLPADIKYLGIDISEQYVRSARKRFSARGTFFLGTAHHLLNHDDSYSCSSYLYHSNG